MYNIYLDFIATSKKEDINLDSIINLPKNSSHKIGDLWRRKTLDYSEWRYVSETYQNTEPNTILMNFYNSIKNYETELVNAIRTSEAQVDIYFVVQNYCNEKINFSIDRELIKFCASINASIRFD